MSKRGADLVVDRVSKRFDGLKVFDEVSFTIAL